MNSLPETRSSLLIRVRDSADEAAWCEFVEIYRPLLADPKEVRKERAARAKERRAKEKS